MELKQNDREYLLDQVEQGKMTVKEANVEKVRMQRVLLVTSKIPKAVRQSLNEAVKCGKLGRIKKEGNKPECYFHPNFKHLVNSERNAHERKVLKAIAGICV